MFVEGRLCSRLCIFPVVLVPKIRTGHSICSTIYVSSYRWGGFRSSRWSDHRQHGWRRRLTRLEVAFRESRHSTPLHPASLTFDRYLKASPQLLRLSLSTSSCPTILPAANDFSTRSRASSLAPGCQRMGSVLRRLAALNTFLTGKPSR